MRITMLSKACIIGAYQRKLEELARLPEIELSVIVPPSWRDKSRITRLEQLHTHGYQLIVAPIWLNGQFHTHIYPTLGRILAQLRPDILHVDEEPYNLATWHALRLGQALGARSLFFTWQNLNRRYPWPFQGFERANYRRAAHAIAGNQDAAIVLRAKGYRGPVTVIPQFGVDPEIYTPGTAPTRVASFTIGYAGRLAAEKGVDILMRACATLGDADWRLRLCGDGDQKDNLQRLSSDLGVATRVEFISHLPAHRMPEFYRELDVLVLPSRTRPNWVEQFGRVLIEAMACEVCVVGSHSGEIPQVIGDAGVVLPEGDAQALGEGLRGLLLDPARRRRLAQQGRMRVLAHFTQAQVAQQTAQVYRELSATASRA